ncbi:hypothetical protein IMZ48_22570 [Candidatus Bathyarchaeota archaeon]|nr:hypothetical protein [Candidatus Bathyarchaeota archaeon]
MPPLEVIGLGLDLADRSTGSALALVAVTAAATVALLWLVRATLYPRGQSILPSPLRTQIPGLLEKEAARMECGSDAYPGARDVTTPVSCMDCREGLLFVFIPHLSSCMLTPMLTVWHNPGVRMGPRGRRKDPLRPRHLHNLHDRLQAGTSHGRPRPPRHDLCKSIPHKPAKEQTPTTHRTSSAAASQTASATSPTTPAST